MDATTETIDMDHAPDSEGDWSASVVLGGLAGLLLLYTITLPQHGDGAIGTAMVYMAAAALFALQLVVSLTQLAWRFTRSSHPARARHARRGLAALLIAPACLLVTLLVIEGPGVARGFLADEGPAETTEIELAP